MFRMALVMERSHKRLHRPGYCHCEGNILRTQAGKHYGKIRTNYKEDVFYKHEPIRWKAAETTGGSLDVLR